MSVEKPVIFILHGDDKMAIEAFIDVLSSRMGDPSMAELNTTHLDGRLASDEDIRTAALAIPFLSDRRLVILANPLARLTNPASHERFIKLLDSLPDTTAFVLVIEDHSNYRGWGVLKTEHWLMKWVPTAGKRVFEHGYSLPDAREMPGWIIKQAKAAGGKFTQEAALALADHTGSDTALASQEIEKLLTYVNGHQRAVEMDDVELLVVTGGPVSVFKMVEALAERSSRQSVRLLNALLADTDPSHIFGLIVRQFRFLVQIREILDEGGDQNQVVREIKSLTYARQYVSQARLFTQAELDAVHHRLLELDEAIKTSQISDELALELLVAEITH